MALAKQELFTAPNIFTARRLRCRAAPSSCPCDKSRPPRTMGGKNPGKPQKRAGGGGGGDDQTEAEKPFHSKEFMQQELDNLLNAPERPTWDEFKEQQRKKGEMEGDMDKVEQEAQDRFRKELDADRAARLARKPAEEEGGSKKKKKDKHKSKKDKARRPAVRPLLGRFRRRAPH